MKAEFVSSLVLRETSRSAVARGQSQLAKAEVEVSTGRHADVGLALGSGVSRLIDTRQLAVELDAIAAGNDVVSARFATTQSALSSMVDLAQGFFDTLVTSRQTGSDRATLIEEARSRLGSLVALASATSNGAHVFSGINSAVPPIADYLAEPPGAARTAVHSAFVAEFGFTPDDPAAATITGAQMDAYLSAGFDALFDDPAWSASFSAASDTALRDRIAPQDSITSPVTANGDGIRSLMKALVAVIDSGTADLNAEAFDNLASRITTDAGDAIQDLLRAQSELGVAQERLAKASERISIERSLIEETIGRAEGVDSYEAAIRLTTLTTQLEASYAVTARMQQLSLLNYL